MINNNYMNMHPSLRYSLNKGPIYTKVPSKIEKIPLPNEIENINAIERQHERTDNNIRTLFGNLFKNICFEEILLIGLIILLIEEGAVDEFLLIVLIYILIAGH